MNKNKREILKGLAIGSAWATPVVSGVMLPAHANTSDTEPGLSCSNDPAGTTGELAVVITFDGDTTCSLISDLGPTQTNEMMRVDLDQNSGTDFQIGNGVGWDTQVGSDNQPAGAYSIDVTRTSAPNNGEQFRVNFTFSESGVNPNKTLTVSDVSIVGPLI